ncbi:MAG: SLC13 family permease [Alphaproteobacteria bacterium]
MSVNLWHNHCFLVQGIFFISCALTIYFILRRPYLYIRIGKRRFSLETYFMGILLAPVILLLSGLINFNQALIGLEGTSSLKPLGILALFLSMVFMSIFLDITGFFEFCARLALKRAGNNGKKLFFFLYFAVSVLTVFTSNDIIILTFTPFIYYFTKEAKIDPKPYLIAEFFAANTWSMMLYIGNPTNILLASAYNLKFLEYTKLMLLPTIMAGLANMFLLYMLFYKSINKPLELTSDVNPSQAITDKTGMFLGLGLLVLCIIFLSLAPYYHIDMWLVSLGFALILLLILICLDFMVVARRKIAITDSKICVLPATLKRMPWTVVPFLLSLFVMIEALKIYGVTDSIGSIFAGLVKESSSATVFIFGFFSALSANVINNIPMTVAYVPIIAKVSATLELPAVLATTIGSNLGANITPIGALAGIMWVNLLKGRDLHLSFLEFVKYGFLVTPITLGLSLLVLTLEML